MVSGAEAGKGRRAEPGGSAADRHPLARVRTAWEGRWRERKAGGRRPYGARRHGARRRRRLTRPRCAGPGRADDPQRVASPPPQAPPASVQVWRDLRPTQRLGSQKVGWGPKKLGDRGVVSPTPPLLSLRSRAVSPLRDVKDQSGRDGRLTRLLGAVGGPRGPHFLPTFPLGLPARGRRTATD